MGREYDKVKRIAYDFFHNIVDGAVKVITELPDVGEENFFYKLYDTEETYETYVWHNNKWINLDMEDPDVSGYTISEISDYGKKVILVHDYTTVVNESGNTLEVN